MSEQDQRPPNDQDSVDRTTTDDAAAEPRVPTDETLTRLLGQAHRPPRMDAAARARIRTRLLEQQAKLQPQTKLEPQTKLSPTEATATTRPTSRSKLLRGWFGRVGLAAAAMLTAVIAVLLAQLWPSSRVYENGDLAPKTITLENGATITLDTATIVEVADNQRLELIRGRVWANIPPSEEPMRFATKHGETRASSTEFALDLTDRGTSASVARGQVSMVADNTIEVAAGHQGTIAQSGAATLAAAPRLSHIAGWTRPTFEQDTIASDAPIRRGNLLARDPRWGGEWPLPIRDLTVDVHVEGSVARTTIDQTFFNHTTRQLEGVYSFPLPPDAAISRLAMYVDGRLMEGAVVERDRGRDIYESIVHQRRDPALLEWMGGNLFRIRIFPLPARRNKRIILSYTQTVETLYGTKTVAVPIPEIDRPVQNLTYRVRFVGGAAQPPPASSHEMRNSVEGEDRILSFSAQNHTIGKDLSLELRTEESTPTAARHVDQDHEYFIVPAAHEFGAEPSPAVNRRWIILYDTSASRTPSSLALQRGFVESFLSEVDVHDEAAIVTFDTAPRVLGEGFFEPHAGIPQSATTGLANASREGLGTTDLAAALRRATALAQAHPSQAHPHVLLLTDGELPDGTELKALQASLAPDTRIIAVAVGEHINAPLLQGLASGSDGYFTHLSAGDDVAWEAFDLVSALNTPRAVGVEAELVGAEGKPLDGALVYGPRFLSDGQQGLFVARVPKDTGARGLRLRGQIGDRPWSHSVALADATTGATYLPRLFAQRHIEHRIREGIDAHADEISRLGMDHFLVTPLTSLLVVETEQMAKDFGLSLVRKPTFAPYAAPTKIDDVYQPVHPKAQELNLDESTVIVREPLVLFRAQEPFGLGSLGVIGAGFGGGGLEARHFGSGHGRLGGRVRMGAPDGFFYDGKSGTKGRGDTNTLVVAASGHASLPFRAQLAQPTSTTTPSSPWNAPRRRSLRSTRLRDNAAAESLPRNLEPSLLGDLDGLRGETHNLQLNALAHSSDRRLHDLASFIPALSRDATDTFRRITWLNATERGAPQNPAEPEALELINKAFQRQGAVAYEASDGSVTSLRDGVLSIVRVGRASLKERVVVDEAGVHAFYPELELVVRKPIDDGRGALLVHLAPFLVARAEPLQASFEVRAPHVSTDRRTIELTLADSIPSAGQPSHRTIIRWTLDGQNRLVAFQQDGATSRQWSVDRNDEDLTLVNLRGASTTLKRVPLDGAAFTTATPAGWTELQMPLLQPANQTETIAPQGRALVHTLASLAAVGDTATIRDLLSRDEERGALPTGTLALISGVFHQLPSDLQQRITGSAEQPIGRYLLAMTSTQDARALDDLANQPGLIGTLAGYRRVQQLSERTGTSAASLTEAFNDFLEHNEDAELALALAKSSLHRHEYKNGELVRGMWRALGQRHPRLRTSSLLNAARIYGNDRDETYRLVHTAVLGSIQRHEAPTFPGDLGWQLRAGDRGEAGFMALWTPYRTACVTSKVPGDWLALLTTQEQLGRTDELKNTLDSLAGRTIAAADESIALAAIFARHEHPEEALRLIKPHLVGPRAHDALVLAATTASTLGHHDDAVEYATRSIDVAGPMPLDDLRAHFAWLVELEARAALRSGRSVANALNAAAKWRRIDPDNPEIDIQCAEILTNASQDEQAWRHLSSILERHPAEGQAHAQVADVLMRNGKLDQAVSAYQRAAELEPTNPTWKLQLATVHFAQGNERMARQILEKIVNKETQPRFDGIVRQAKALLEQP